MVFVDIPCTLTCDNQPACNEREPAGLVLNIGGAFAFKPKSQAWQVTHENGIYLTFCPKHHRAIVKPGVIQAPNASVTRGH